jgi:hypothetical protein
MITTAQDAAKAAIAFLKNLDDSREISVEQVTSNDKDHEWTVHISLVHPSSVSRPPSWKRLSIREDQDGKLLVTSKFESAPLG